MKKTAISVALVLICAFASAQGNFQIPDEDTYGYFFAHQSSNGAWTAYALSPDAIHFHSLICGNAIMDNAGAPYVCRTRDGKGFIMTFWIGKLPSPVLRCPGEPQLGDRS